MRLALIADVFPPLRSSGAVQLRDLSREIARQGHDLTVLIPAPEQRERWRIEQIDGVTVVRLRAPKTKDRNYAFRAMAELAMPYAMRHAFRASPLGGTRFEGVIWYSPTIFLGPIVRWAKRRSNCRSYLIIRDIFPQWAADMGIMSRWRRGSTPRPM